MSTQVKTGYPSIDKPWLKYYDEESIDTVLPNMSICDYMKQCNSDNLHDVALRYYGARITFEQMFQHIDSVARALVAIGVREDDIVTLTLPTMPETVYLFYAINCCTGCRSRYRS